MIRLEHVSKKYGSAQGSICAVNDVSLEAAPGAFIVITGPSGSGKTTFLNLIGGMARPDGGSIFIQGADLTSMNDAEISSFRGRTIGFVFQFQSMLSTLTVLDNVLLPSLFSGSKPDVAAAVSLLDEVGMKQRAGAYAHELSIGQQRRVSIVRALIGNPALLLCDEPTGDLDPESESVIMGLLDKANKKGVTIIMVTHNHGLQEFASEMYTCKEGFLLKTSNLN